MPPVRPQLLGTQEPTARLRSSELGWFCMPGRCGPAWGHVYGACAHTGRQMRAPGVCMCAHACAFHSGPHMPPVHGSGCSRGLRSWVFGVRGPPLSAFGALAVHPLPTGPGRVPCSRRSQRCWACSAGLTLLETPRVGPPQSGLSGCQLRLRDPGSCLHPRMRAGLRNGRKSPTHSICSPVFLNQCFLEQFWVHRTSSRCTEIPIPADSPPSFPTVNTSPEGTLVLILTSHSHGLPQAQD